MLLCYISRQFVGFSNFSTAISDYKICTFRADVKWVLTSGLVQVLNILRSRFAKIKISSKRSLNTSLLDAGIIESSQAWVIRSKKGASQFQS